MFFFQIKGTPIHGEESGPPSLPPLLSSGRLAISRRWLHSPSVNEGGGPASGKRRREGVRERGRGEEDIKASSRHRNSNFQVPTSTDGRADGRTSRKEEDGGDITLSLPPSFCAVCVSAFTRFAVLTALPPSPLAPCTSLSEADFKRFVAAVVIPRSVSLSN